MMLLSPFHPDDPFASEEPFAPGDRPGTCGGSDHLTRRTLLRGAGLAGLGWLTPLSRQLARGAEKSGARPKSLIVLWLQGGASQVDTFDPHPGSPIAHGARAIDTAAPDIRLGEGLERTAERMSDLSVIRSVVGDEGDHARATYNAKTGFRPFPGLTHPSIGAVICHELPSPTGETAVEIPTHISILPSRAPARGGYLGAQFDAFQVGDPQRPVADVRSQVKGERRERRYESLDVLEDSFARGRLPDLEERRTLHRSTIDRARRMMASEQLDAFDVSEAPASERERYGDTPFGRGCLAAARLVDTGVRCVEVTLRGWDTHIDNREGQREQKAVLDPAIAALVDGLKARERWEDTIVLVGTEFGRTPTLNATEGRDHWPHGFSVLLGGGGLLGGVALGATDPSGEKKKPADPVRVEDIHTTILKRLGIDTNYEFTTPIGRPLPVSEGRPLWKFL